jgi:putative DNA primase/helicase
MSADENVTLSWLLERLCNVRSVGKGFKSRCPAHDDSNPSLSIRETNGKILIKCFAGCTTDEVCKALGIQLTDLFSESRSAKRIVAEYPYTDETGRILYQNVRFEPKDFRLRRPNGKGGWTWNLGDTRRVLYRLPEVLAAEEILIVEGEKDAETAITLGFAATTSGAAGSWNEQFSDCLRGKRVTIIADNDDAGRKHAHKVIRSLLGRASSVKLLELPGAKDLTEWVEHAGTAEHLVVLIDRAGEWQANQLDGRGTRSAIRVYPAFCFLVWIASAGSSTLGCPHVCFCFR